MKKFFVFFIFFSSLGFAQDRNGQGAIGMNVGGVIEAPWASQIFRNAVSPGPKVSLLGRYHHDSPFSGFELNLDYFKLGQTKISSSSAAISFFWRAYPLDKLHPVFAIGAGITSASNYFSSRNSSLPFFRLRAGVEWELQKNMDLTFHLDHLTIFKNFTADPNLHVLAPSIGVLFYFGNPPAPTPAPVANIKGGAEKSESPKLDFDQDGILDGEDLCKGTEKGSEVNRLGCALGQYFELNLGLDFLPSSLKISPASAKQNSLAELASLLSKNPDMRVEIHVHTDNSGKERENLKLSERRAEAIRKILVSKYQIGNRRIKTVGHGSKEPVDSNSSAEGRRNNRRVMARIIR